MKFNEKKHPFSIRVWNNQLIKIPDHVKGEDLMLKQASNWIISEANKLPITFTSCSSRMMSDAQASWNKINKEPIPEGAYVVFHKSDTFVVIKKGMGGFDESDVFVHWSRGFDLVALYSNDTEDKTIRIVYDNFTCSGVAVGGEVHENTKDIRHVALCEPFAALLFKHYAELKTKVLNPKQKHKNFHCRYKNEMPFPIDLCDENWYTKSVQGHPFIVRGHWRLQACGKGLKDRKLKWIDPYMKDGYTKGAYMEKDS